LSGSVDPKGTAHKAMAQFGFGFMEIGPVTVEPIIPQEPIQLDEKEKRSYTRLIMKMKALPLPPRYPSRDIRRPSLPLKPPSGKFTGANVEAIFALFIYFAGLILLYPYWMKGGDIKLSTSSDSLPLPRNIEKVEQ